MSKGIVDVFEAVQVQKQHCGKASLPPRKRDRLVNPVNQEHSIGQPGEEVVLSGMG